MRASALKMSVPRRKPPSTTIGARPATPAATSGTHSTDDRRLFSMPPPWFETLPKPLIAICAMYMPTTLVPMPSVSGCRRSTFRRPSSAANSGPRTGSS